MIENFQLFLNVIVYFLNFSGIICMMFVITVDFSYFSMMTQLFNNWNLGFISDIKFQNKTKSEKENMCPDGYEYLFSYTWPGTKAGCNCLGIYNMTGYNEYENRLIIGSCPLIMTKFGCKSVADLPSKTLHALENKFYCVKRNNFNYFTNYSESIFNLMCPPGKKSCGIIDTLNNMLCVDENYVCPIEQTKNINNVIYSNNLNVSGTNSFNNNSTLPILIQNLTKNFIQFKISQGNICINNNEVDLNSNEVFELYKGKKSMKCSTKLSDNIPRFRYDFRYQPLLITDTDKLFYKEDFLKTNIKTLPHFPPNYFDDLVVIYGRNYIGWNKKCQDYIYGLKEIHEFAIQIEQYSIFYLVYSLAILIYCMLFIMIFKELLFEQYRIKILIIVVHIILIVIIFVFVLKDNIEITRCIELCFVIIKKRCSDEQTNRLVLYVLEAFEYISRLFDATIVLYVVMILFSIVKILLTCYKIYKRNILMRVMQGNVNEFEMVLLM